MPSSSQQQALREAVAAAINSADGGPPRADGWSRQAADAAIGVVLDAVQAAIEQMQGQREAGGGVAGWVWQADVLAVVERIRAEGAA